MSKKDMKLIHEVLGHLLVGLLIQSHRSLIHLIHTLIRFPRTVHIFFFISTPLFRAQPRRA